LLVQKIQQQLAPTAKGLQNVFFPGLRSKTDRQIDVLVRQKIGKYEMLIVLDCKDHARPIDANGVLNAEKDTGQMRSVRQILNLAIRRLSPGDQFVGDAAPEITVLRDRAGKVPLPDPRTEILEAIDVLRDRRGY